MTNRKRLNIRIDSELDALLRSRATKGLTAFVESLIVKGLITEITELYDSAIAATAREGGIFKNTVEREEIIKLNKRAEEIEIELKYQHKLLINICVLGGLEKDKIKKLASDVKDAKDHKGRLRFHNRLIAEIARTKNHTMEDITNWMKDD